jgi:hypothetical protein
VPYLDVDGDMIRLPVDQSGSLQPPHQAPAIRMDDAHFPPGEAQARRRAVTSAQIAPMLITNKETIRVPGAAQTIMLTLQRRYVPARAVDDVSPSDPEVWS